MATAEKTEETEETKKTKKDEMTGDELVFNPNAIAADGTKGDYVPAKMSRALYRQQKQAQSRQAVTAGGMALAGEVGQFLVGLSVMDDPTIKSARRDLARLEAETRKTGPTMSESEKNRYREALNAPVQRAQEALERKAQAIAASSGDQSVRTFLQAAKTGMGDVRQQAMQTEAVIAKEQVRRDSERDLKIDKARKEADEIRAMFLDLRNTYVREPLHKFIGDASKYIGTVAAYAPAPDFSAEIAAARKAEVSDEQLERLIQLSRGPFAKKRVNKYMAEIGVDMPAKKTMETDKEKKLEMERELKTQKEVVDIIDDDGTAATEDEAVEELVDPNDPSYQYKRLPDGSYEVRRRQADGSYKRTGTAKKGSAAFDAIDDLFPEDAPVSEGEKPVSEMTEEELRERKRKRDEQAAKDKAKQDALNKFFQELSETGKRKREKDRKRREAVARSYTKQTEFLDMGPLYKKGKYLYGFRDGVWSVYPNVLAYVSNQPYQQAGKPVRFSIEDTKRHPKSGVRELYDLAHEEGLID